MDKNRERPIKALIELPTWLGDCVMTTPAIENIIKHYQNIEITIIGSFTATELIKNNQKILKKIVIDSKITSLYPPEVPSLTYTKLTDHFLVSENLVYIL